jgi:hypothetical protein
MCEASGQGAMHLVRDAGLGGMILKLRWYMSFMTEPLTMILLFVNK